MTSNFTMIQGDTKLIRYQCFNNDGTPLDLATSSSATFGVIRYGSSNSVPIITKNFASGITIENTNEAVVKLEPSDTSGIFGKFYFTFTLEDFSGDSFSDSGIFIVEINANA